MRESDLNCEVYNISEPYGILTKQRAIELELLDNYELNLVDVIE